MVIQRFRPMFSGQGIQVEALAAALVRREVDVSVITATPGTGRSVETCDGYSVVRLGTDPPSIVPAASRSRLTGAVFASRAFSYLQIHGRFDLVHVHAMTDALYTSYAWCRLHDKPLLFEMTLVGADDPLTVARSTNRFAALRLRLYHRCDGYVAISPALEAACREAGVPGGRVRLVPQGVDVSTFSPVDDRLALRRELGLPMDGALLTFVGSLIHRKGIDLLLKAWVQIHRAFPMAHLLLVGRDRFGNDTGSTTFLSAQLSQVPSDAIRHVHQLGMRDDVHRLLQASDVFGFPSRREGFGTVMIEAMACGLPCVVAELQGITDFIFGEHGRIGVVVPQEDHRALAAAVNNLLGDLSRARRLGRAARLDAVSRFDIEEIAGRYIEYYEDLISEVATRTAV